MKKIFPTFNQILKLDCLANKTAIITGGATGLGKTMAKHFAANNVNTIICSRNEDRLKETSELINQKYPNKVSYYSVDVADNRSVDDLFVKFNQNNIKPDILINNAAGNFISKTEDLTPNAINKVIDIVLKGTINMTMNFGKEFRQNDKYGCILNISALYAETGTSFVVPSSISKSGINNLTKSLSVEWGKYGIRSLAVAPGSIFTKGAFSRLDPTGEFIKKLNQVNPSGRLGNSAELANLITFLTSDYCHWLNGEIINFDGGENNFRCGQLNELNNLPDEFWNIIKK
tara:strand:- start:444 stop:1307 length:864 start_codon:yes stop_codon:yes gene_type:complete